MTRLVWTTASLTFVFADDVLDDRVDRLVGVDGRGVVGAVDPGGEVVDGVGQFQFDAQKVLDGPVRVPLLAPGLHRSAEQVRDSFLVGVDLFPRVISDHELRPAG